MAVNRDAILATCGSNRRRGSSI